MNKHHAKRRRDIKTKLMAAICMLLVSSIMMVSTTYAWFTLSTAPEVTGINTAVGANGNLEMALLPVVLGEDGTPKDVLLLDDYGVTTSSSDGVKEIAERNTTWGNLVDVSNNTIYGMDQITLYPSQLNQSDTGGVVMDDAGNPTKLPTGALLQTPVYGADGRINYLEANTQTGILEAANGTKVFVPGENKLGVRAVGTASGLSARELSYRNARAAADDARGMAADDAKTSLSVRGNNLAGIAVKMAAGGNQVYTDADWDALGAIISDLTKEDGVLDLIETSYMQYILAFAASSANIGENSDEVWAAVEEAVKSDGATLSAILALIEDRLPAGISLPTELSVGIAAFQTTVSNVAQAQAMHTQKDGQDEYSWENDVRPLLELLANPDNMQINDKGIDSIKADKQPLINDIMAGKGLTVSITTGGGVYADVADHCGDYTASIHISGIEFSGIDIDTTATMKTKTTVDPSYLADLGNYVGRLGAPSTSNEIKPMTDIFGYIIDLAFRTNAADSNLLLQADAVDRIYGETTGVEIEVGEDAEGNKIYESTMGHGASMTFKATNPTFSDDQVKNLMRAIRIVFFDPTSMNVLATAKLDVDKATNGTDGITAKMYIYTLTEGGEEIYTVTAYEEGKGDNYWYVLTPATYETATDTNGEGPYYTKVGDEYVLAENTEAEGTYYVKTADEKYDVVTDAEAKTKSDAQEKLYTKTIAAAGEIRSADNKIMALTQNTAHALSVLVYLDGNVVTNADVSATGSSSMKGTMNLQFSSSAQLTPMEYTPLMGQPITETPEEP